MNRDLMKLATGETKPVTREERRLAREAQEVIAEVRLTGLKVDGSLGLAGHTMEGVIGLDDYRKDLAKEDPARHLLLAGFEETALQQVTALQRGLYDKFGL